MKTIAKPQSKPQFTGIARSIVCFDNQGFKNFKVVTLHIQDGEVIKQELSDAYANFECLSRIELATQISMTNLNNEYANGVAFKK